MIDGGREKKVGEHLVVFTTTICLSILSAMQLTRNGILFEKRIGLKESEHHIYEIIILKENFKTRFYVWNDEYDPQRASYNIFGMF